MLNYTRVYGPYELQSVFGILGPYLGRTWGSNRDYVMAPTKVLTLDPCPFGLSVILTVACIPFQDYDRVCVWYMAIRYGL